MIKKNPENLADKAYKIIKRNILDGIFHEGYMLSEVELADSLKMSRTPVREALKRLYHEELIIIKPRIGNFVKHFSWEEMRQVEEMAEGLEGMVVKLATEKASENDLEKLIHTVDLLENALSNNDIDGWINTDVVLHSILLEIANNKFIETSVRSINEKIHTMRLITMTNIEFRELSTKEHRKIVEAMMKRNSELARRLTQDHWTKARNRTGRYIQSISPKTSNKNEI